MLFPCHFGTNGLESHTPKLEIVRFVYLAHPSSSEKAHNAKAVEDDLAFGKQGRFGGKVLVKSEYGLVYRVSLAFMFSNRPCLKS